MTIRCIKTILFIEGFPNQHHLSKWWKFQPPPNQQKKGLYWQVRIHTKRQTLEKLMTKSFGHTPSHVKQELGIFFCFADGSLLIGISYFMDWFVNWFMDSSIFQQNLTQGMPKKVQFWVPPAENQLGVQETPGKIRRWSDLCCGGTVISMLRRGTFCGSIDEEQEGNSEKKTWRVVLMWWHCIWQNVSGLPEYESNRTHQKKKKK